MTSEKTGGAEPYSYGLTQASYLQLSQSGLSPRCGLAKLAVGSTLLHCQQCLPHQLFVLEYIALAPAVSYIVPAPLQHAAPVQYSAPTMTVAGRRLEQEQKCPQIGIGSICAVWRTSELRITGTHDDGNQCRHEARRHSRCAATTPVQVRCTCAIHSTSSHLFRTDTCGEAHFSSACCELCFSSPSGISCTVACRGLHLSSFSGELCQR